MSHTEQPAFTEGRAFRRQEGGVLGYTRGFSAGFHAAPISVTPVTLQGVPIGNEEFFSTKEGATNRIYHSDRVIPRNTRGTKPLGNARLRDNIFTKRFVNNERVHSTTQMQGRVQLYEHYRVRLSAERVGADVFKP